MSDVYRQAGGRLSRFKTQKTGESTFSNPSLVSLSTRTLANQSRGFGLSTNDVSQRATEESTNLQETQSANEQSLLSLAIGQQSFSHDFSRLALHSLQTKLTVGEPGDKYEQEADAIANQVMRMVVPDTLNAPVQSVKNSLQRKCAACEKEDKIQTKPSGQSANDTGLQIGDNLESRLNSSKGGGNPLPDDVRSFMEPRFGADFSGVRVHTGGDAMQMNRDLSAQAFTHQQDIYYGAGKSPAKDALTAHELSHVLQQSNTNVSPSIQRFHLPHGADPDHQVDESSVIAPTFNDLLNTIKAIAKDSTVPGGFLGDTVNMDLFVQKAGGRPATAEIDKKLGTKSTQKVPSMLNYRYLFTCRAGLIDMRHFIQLMYISHFTASAFPGTNGNRYATKKGREHELNSESESRFGAEDTTSNALGAFTGSRLAGTPMPNDLVQEIETILRRSDPLDFVSLSPASQDTIKHHYGDLVADPTPKHPGDLIPAHQNQTALPDILNIPECSGRERSFPFKLDTNDPDKKTISETAFGSGSKKLTSDSDIRDFVTMQRTEIIKALSTAEKLRMVKRLFEGWVADEDLDAIEIIYKNSTDAEKSQIKASIDPNDLSGGQKIRLKLIFEK